METDKKYTEKDVENIIAQFKLDELLDKINEKYGLSEILENYDRHDVLDCFDDYDILDSIENSWALDEHDEQVRMSGYYDGYQERDDELELERKDIPEHFRNADKDCKYRFLCDLFNFDYYNNKRRLREELLKIVNC